MTLAVEDVIAGVRDVTDLRRLTPSDFGNRIITDAEIRHIARICEALWLHSGDPKDPHAELTSGKCSNGFVDVLRMLKFANVCDLMAFMLVRILKAYPTFPGAALPNTVDWVVGSDHAAATLSFSVARYFRAQHDFTEKGLDKTQDWRRFAIQPGEGVLQVEELVTTTGTLQAVRDGIRRYNPNVQFLPFVATLVHRSPVYKIEGAPIIFLVHFDIETWEPDKCPLCAQGSKRLRPKANWAELTHAAS